LGWRVKWTRLAWSDVEEAARFIDRDSPRYAVVLQREAQAAAQSLRQFALRGRVVRGRTDERLRELIVGTYRLIYRIADDEVWVIVAGLLRRLNIRSEQPSMTHAAAPGASPEGIPVSAAAPQVLGGTLSDVPAHPRRSFSHISQ
jgi:plasmid stabilization system protein ParE